MNIQDWFPLELTGLISLQSKGSQEWSPVPQFESINSSPLSRGNHGLWAPPHLEMCMAAWFPAGLQVDEQSPLSVTCFPFLLNFLPSPSYWLPLSLPLLSWSFLFLCREQDAGRQKLTLSLFIIQDPFFPIWNILRFSLFELSSLGDSCGVICTLHASHVQNISVLFPNLLSLLWTIEIMELDI